MDPTAQQRYLTTEIMTATPQKLQLALIEAAIRFTEQTRRLWRAGEHDRACATLIRAQEVIAAILGGMHAEVSPELVKRVAGIYLFVYRTLVDANLTRDEQKLDEALRVLRIESETWRMLCDTMGGTAKPETDRGATVVPPPHRPATGWRASDDRPVSGFSFEA